MNIIKTLLVVAILLITTGCGTKTPYKEKEPISGAALLYVYVVDNISPDESMTDASFKLRINNLNVADRVRAGEHKVFDMKPATVLVSAVRNNVMIHNVKLKMEAGHIYYLEIYVGTADEDFTFTQMSPEEGKKGVAKTALANSFEKDMAAYVSDFAGSTAENHDGTVAVPAMSEAEIDAIIEKKLNAKMATMPKPAPTPAPAQAKPSISRVEQMDQLDRAFGMKEKGILTDAEYQKMKAEILGK
jgi:hypothetical protein